MSAKISYRDNAANFNVYELADHTLLANGFLIDDKNQPAIYRDGPKPSPLSPRKQRSVRAFRSVSRFNVIELKNATWACRPNSGTYSRWLLETLLKIYCLDAIDWKVPIIVDRALLSRKWVVETLKIFDRDFIFVPHRSEIKTSKLFFTDVDWKALAPESEILKKFAGFLAARLSAKDFAAPAFRRIHISRQRSRRKISNIDAVRRILKKFDVAEVYLEDFTLAEQIKILNGAEFVIAPHGAGLANIIFMPSGGSVLELQHGRVFPQDELFSMVSASVGLNHSVLKGDRRIWSSKNADIRVNTSQLEERLAEALRS